MKSTLDGYKKGKIQINCSVVIWIWVGHTAQIDKSTDHQMGIPVLTVGAVRRPDYPCGNRKQSQIISIV